MTAAKHSQHKFAGIKEDILGAGLHLLSGAGGDLKLIVKQAVERMVGDAYVSRIEYESLLRRIAELEVKSGKKPVKNATKAAAKKPKNTAKQGRK